MNTKLLAVIVVVIIVVAACAVVVTSGDDDDSDYSATLDIDDSEYPCNLMILGNANMDDYLDDEDVDYILDLLEDVPTGDEYNDFYNTYYFCDANYDGLINEDDVDYVSLMIEGAWGDGIQYVYYVNADFDIGVFDMTVSNRYVITLITPPLDNILFLNESLLVGTDMRPSTGQYKPQYEAVLASIEEKYDRTLYNVGIASSPTMETISSAAEEYDNQMIVVCGGSSFGSSMETTLAGSGVQVIRIPTWESSAALPGLMTLAYMLDGGTDDGISEMERAYEYMDWYYELSDYVDACVESVASADIPNAAAVYSHYDPMQLLGSTSGEYRNVLKLGVGDVTGDYLGDDASGGHGNQISLEVVYELIENYDLDVLIGMQGAPFQIEDNEYGMGSSASTAQGSYAAMKDIYDKWYDELGDAFEEGDVDFVVMGYTFSIGIAEPVGWYILGYYLYGEEYGFTLDLIEEYVNWFCDQIGILDIDGDGVTTTWDSNGRPYEWSFDNMNLLYAGEDNEKNIMNRPDSA